MSLNVSAVLLALAVIVVAVLAFLLWKGAYTRAVRRDTLLRARAVMAGQAFEHLAPYLPDFPFNPKDARFLGSPVDFVVFDGLTEGAVRGICFVEMKTGGSSLTTRERQVRDAIEARQVTWYEMRETVDDA
jgi:predicted Holliday junction resolvase-like endonuclease